MNSADSSAASIAEAQGLDAAFLAAFNEGDGEAVAKCFIDSADTVLFPPREMALEGFEAIRIAFTESMSGDSGIRMEFSQQRYLAAGDKVFSWGNWKMTGLLPSGETLTSLGRYTAICGARDGRWGYLVNHASEPIPMPDIPDTQTEPQ